MTTLRQDPLLGIARALLTFMIGLTVLIGALLAFAIPFVLLNQAKVAGEFGPVSVEFGRSAAQAGGEVIGAILAVLVLVVALAALAFVFLRQLRRIVDTVRQGDPFIPENAVRLRTMAWLSIVLQVIALFAGALTMWLEEATGKLEANFDVSVGGILLPLVLFILARVFRRGAEMREELEGTV